jgi:tRNA A37 threonylcarbamoyladenosine dehydratase
MEENAFSRFIALAGEEDFNKLTKKNVAIFGVGGVGSYVAEAVARSGIENITLVDSDTVNVTNINRQIIALHSTVGKSKVSVMGERIRDINPLCNVTEKNMFFDESTVGEFDFTAYDYVFDCIDSVNSKILLIKECKSKNVNIISAMGAGNKLCPEMAEIADIKDTSYCPLARAVRNRLKKEGIYSLTVVYSKEEPKKSEGVPKSCAFVPSVFGLMMASYGIREMLK